METSQITLIGIGVTFLIGALNFLYSMFNNKKTSFVNNITSSRVRWIGDFRNNISDYTSQIPVVGSGWIVLFERKREFVEKLNRSRMTIELMLNQKDDAIIIENLDRIRKNVNEILKCLDLLKFQELKEYDGIDGNSVFDFKVGLIKQLSEDTRLIFKKSMKARFPDGNEDPDPTNLMIQVEYENWRIKKAAYVDCINELSKKINSEVSNLNNNTKMLLKNEWERVKLESLVGKYDVNNSEWNLKVGIAGLNKICKLIFIIMIVSIIILIFIA